MCDVVICNQIKIEDVHVKHNNERNKKFVFFSLDETEWKSCFLLDEDYVMRNHFSHRFSYVCSNNNNNKFSQAPVTSYVYRMFLRVFNVHSLFFPFSLFCMRFCNFFLNITCVHKVYLVVTWYNLNYT